MSGENTLADLARAIKSAREAHTEFQRVNDERLDALAAKNESRAAELDEQLKKVDASLSESLEAVKQIQAQIEFDRTRIELLEGKSDLPGLPRSGGRKSEYLIAFEEFIRAARTGDTSEQERKLRELERKDVTIGTPASGGLAVPEEISRMIEAWELLHSPVRRLVNVVTVGTSDYKALLNTRGANVGWVGETDTRNATNTPEFREVAPTMGEIYAYPQVSEWSLDDIFFNVENWLVEEIVEAMSIAEGTAVISGNGTNKPTGMLNTTPVTTADFASPARAAAAYQFVACESTSSPAAAEILGDCLIDLVYAVRSAYRRNGTFTMNSLTAAAVRKLKDADGQYIWQPGLVAGQPDRILGYPLEIWEQMPDIGTNNFPIGFGDYNRAYRLVDRVGMRMTRDNITTPGYVKFYLRRRVGGIPYNNDAVKFIRTTLPA